MLKADLWLVHRPLRQGGCGAVLGRAHLRQRDNLIESTQLVC